MDNSHPPAIRMVLVPDGEASAPPVPNSHGIRHAVESTEDYSSMPFSQTDMDLRPLFDACPIAMIVIDSAGRIVSAAGGLLQLLDWTPGKLVGRSFEQALTVGNPVHSSSQGPRHSSRHRRRIRSGTGRIVEVEDEITRLPVAGRSYWEVHILRRAANAGTPQPPSLLDGDSSIGGSSTETMRTRHVRMLLDYLPAGVALFNESGSFISGNQAAQHMLGRPDENTNSLIPNPARSGPLAGSAVLQASLRQCFQSRTPVVEKAVKWSKRGELRHLDWRLQPVGPSDAERPAAVLALIVDVTDRVRGEQSLRETVIAAETVSHRKTMFLSAVSHDLRTPVNTINLQLDVLRLLVEKRGETDKDLIPTLNVLDKAVNGLTEMLDDLLDISRIDSGRLDDRPSIFAFDSWFEATLAPHEATASLKNIDFTWRVDRPGQQIHCDRIKLSRVLVNLVHNAVKFTQSGSIDVAASLKDEANLILRVKDTGPGIPADQLDLIFDEFAQLNNPSRDPSHGSGLGLAICRRLLESVGGLISVESRVGSGSTFHVRYPLQKIQPLQMIEEQRAVAAITPSQSNSSSRSRLGRTPLLIIDGDGICRQSLAAFLNSSGYAAAAVADAPSALRWLDQTRPWLILLDLGLPGKSGLALLRTIRERNEYRKVPIIVLTTGDVSGECDDFMALNVEGVVPKPVNLGQLVQSLARLSPRS